MIASQRAWLHTQLIAGRKITPQQALKERGAFRLAARVEELRSRGIPIKTRIVRNGSRFWAEYSL